MVNVPPQQRRDTLQWYFATRAFENLCSFHDLFYQHGRKVVPDRIRIFLDSPLTVAVWYMDDGRLDYRKKSHYAYSFSTDAFSVTEVELLQSILFEKFGVESSIHMSLCRGKRYPKLYIGKNGRDQFFSLISPFILDCFAYKLPPVRLHEYSDPSETDPRHGGVR